MPMPVLPRMTAPRIQPPLGVLSNMLPSLSMTDDVRRVLDDARDAARRRAAASPGVVASRDVRDPVRPLLHLRIERQRIAGDERA